MVVDFHRWMGHASGFGRYPPRLYARLALCDANYRELAAFGVGRRGFQEEDILQGLWKPGALGRSLSAARGCRENNQ